MKKKLILVLSIFALMCCFFALTAFAEENTSTYYVVASNDSDTAVALQKEGKETVVLSEIYGSTNNPAKTDWAMQFADGDSIEFIFAENIVESVSEYKGILLNKAITLTVNYNGFCHLVTNGKRENVFVLRHGGAQLNLIGTTDIYDENGNVVKDFTYNSQDLSENNVQIYHGKVYCWVFDGSVYVENIRSKTVEELVFTQNSDFSADGKVINTYEFVDCAINSNGNGIGLEGKNHSDKILKVRGGYVNKVRAYTICTGTLFENCELGGFDMDCWIITNQIAEFVNCTITGKIYTNSGRTHLKLVDCTVSGNISIGSDGGGDGFAMIFTTADCENAGTYELIRNTSKGTAFPWDDMVNEFLADNSAPLGHSASWSLDFEGNKYLSACTATSKCARCNDIIETDSFGAIISARGYSTTEFETTQSIVIGFNVDYSAVAKYEKLSGNTLNLGCVVAAKERLGEGVAPLDSNGNAVALESGQVLKIDVTSYTDSSIFELKVDMGAEHVDAMLLMSAYIIESTDEAIEISYVQGEDSFTDSTSFEYVSYNNH